MNVDFPKAKQDHHDWRLIDPRFIQQASPKTFLLPDPEQISALQRGDHVRLMFEEVTADNDGGVERLWVVFDRHEGGQCHGHLLSAPFGFRGLKPGDPITYDGHHVLALSDRQLEGSRGAA